MSDQVIVTITEIAEQAIVELTEVSESVVVVIQEAANGDTGPIGPTGASGGSTNAWSYNAKTNATSGYPGNGYLLWNNATQTSATSILVSHKTDDNTDIELLLSFFVVNQKIFIQDRDNSSNNQVWQITGTPTVTGANTSTAYYTFPVTLVSSAGAALTNNHSILFGQIVVATNAVTSATTSDGTATLSLAPTQITNTDESSVEYGLLIQTSSAPADDGTDCRALRVMTRDALPITAYSTHSTSLLRLGTNITDNDSAVFSITSTLQINWSASGDSPFSQSLLRPNNGTSYTWTLPTSTGTIALTSDITVTPTNTVTLTNKTLTSPTINSATIGTAATFNATSYTFGTGAAAAMNQKLGTNSVDSRISSLFSAPYNYVQDNFVGKAIVTSGYYSQLNWGIVGSASLSSDLGYYVAGYPGATSISTNNNAFFLYLFGTSAANISLINDTVFDLVFNTSTNTNTVQNFFVGLRSWISATVETGRRGLSFEAGVDTNWQLLHETSAGVQTKIDTGKPALSNQTVRVTIKFVSATQTDMIIATSTSTTPVTVSATSGFSFTGFCGIGMWLKSTTAVSRILIPLRATLAWLTPTL